MTKIDIFSGFLGAGKTTLIKKLITEAYQGEKLVLIENEFGEIGIDGGFLKDAGIEITEMNSGCICCSLVGDFSKALSKVVAEYRPDRILIEPSGVGKLSDVLTAAQKSELEDAEISAVTCIVDAKKCKMYMKNFGEFFGDQIKVAKTVVFSHTDIATPEKVEEALKIVRELNPHAIIVTTPIATLSGEQLYGAIHQIDAHHDFVRETEEEFKNEQHHNGEKCHHHEHHHDHAEDCDCGCHGHHHHDDECHHHEHHHDHAEDCDCGCHGHHHHHHHADEVFSSWGRETTHAYTMDDIKAILSSFDEDAETYGIVLRAKGIVNGKDGQWIHFDYVPGEHDVRFGSASITGKLCVIGSSLNEEKISVLFGL